MLVFCAILLSSFGLGGQSAHAGLFSFLEKWFGEESTDAVSYNSQTLPLLKAPNASELKAATGGAMINLVGDSSLLPVVGPMGSIADVETYKLDQITIYTVREGDTLSGIAEMFGVDVATIYWANDLKKGSLVKTGDMLIILPISGIQYAVKKGDTVKSLAQKFKSDEDEIIAYNNLSIDGPLTVGTSIIIPDAEMGSIPTATAKKTVRGGSGPDLAGYFMRPISGGKKSQGLHGYNGVDLASNCGTPVYVSAGGTVLIARREGWNGGYGRYIVVAHPNGTQTLYAHLLHVSAVVGQYAPQGYQIGSIGTTGNSTGCHLHFEIRGARNPF